MEWTDLKDFNKLPQSQFRMYTMLRNAFTAPSTGLIMEDENDFWDTMRWLKGPLLQEATSKQLYEKIAFSPNLSLGLNKKWNVCEPISRWTHRFNVLWSSCRNISLDGF